MATQLQVASHPLWFGEGSKLSDAGRCTRVRHTALSAFTDGKLVFHNPSPYVIKVRASIEYPSGTYHAVHFTGEDANRDIELPKESSVTSLPVEGVEIPDATNFWTNILLTRVEAFYWAAERYGNIANTAIEKTNPGQRCVTGTTDYTMSANPGVAELLTGFGPQRIEGTVAQASQILIGILGDSIGAGTSDKTNGPVGTLPTFEAGYFARKYSEVWPYFNLSVNGDGGITFSEQKSAQNKTRQALLASCSHIFWEFVTNDLTVFTFAEFRQKYVDAWYLLREPRSAKIYVTTCTPRTKSKTSEEAAFPNFGPEGEPPSNRQQYNNWLRDGAPINISTKKYEPVESEGANVARCPVYNMAGEIEKAGNGPAGHPAADGGIVDIAKVVETFSEATLTWYWKLEYAQEGIHPNEAAHAALKSALPTLEEEEAAAELEASLSGQGMLGVQLSSLVSLEAALSGAGSLTAALKAGFEPAHLAVAARAKTAVSLVATPKTNVALSARTKTNLTLEATTP